MNSSTEKWEFWFKGCSAVAAVVSAISIVVGGAVGLHTYREQVAHDEYLKRKEIRLMRYRLSRDSYFELIDAAAGVASSPNKADAQINTANFYKLYFGKAHLVSDGAVYEAKKAFSRALQKAIEKGVWPTDDLDMPALDLTKACATILKAEFVILDPDDMKRSGLLENSKTGERGARAY